MSNNNSIRDELVYGLAENYIGKIFYFCLKKTSNATEAEDLAQDIILNVIDGLNKGTVPENFSAWVWQIARNKYSAWAIGKRKRREYMDNVSIYDIEIVDEKESSIDVMIQDEQLALLRRELAFIKSDYRNIIVAYYIENKSVKDIAKSLSLSVDAVHQRLHRVREILKEGMNMVRKFGKRSYNPENITFIMNGYNGEKGQPVSIITHLLYKNIFLEVYGNPETAEELALELGIALPYMEDELEFLVREELLRKIGNKYETNFKIVSKEEQLKIHETNKKFSKVIKDKMCELIDLYMKEDGAKVNIDYVGYENAKWTLLARTFDYLFLRSNFQKAVTDKHEEHPKRPDGGEWTISGYENPVDFKKPYFVGLHGYKYLDKKHAKRDINYGQFKFYTNNLYSKTPEHLHDGHAYTLWLICNDKLDECKQEYVDELLKYGYVKKNNDLIVPNIVIFSGYQESNCSQEITSKMSKLKNEIMDLIKNAPQISRGYIVDQALEDGWLKYDENTLNNVGAYIYK